MTHLCHAEGCRAAVPPRIFMCRHHWFALPKNLRDAIWSAYVPGQESRKDPTPDYIEAATNAIEWLRGEQVVS